MDSYLLNLIHSINLEMVGSIPVQCICRAPFLLADRMATRGVFLSCKHPEARSPAEYMRVTATAATPSVLPRASGVTFRHGFLTESSWLPIQKHTSRLKGNKRVTLKVNIPITCSTPEVAT